MRHHPQPSLVERTARRIARLRWLPVRVRQFPYSLLDRVRRLSGRPDPAARGGAHFAFFTCRAHFHLLECAIDSLGRLPAAHIKGVSVFVDETDYLGDGQVAALRASCPAIQVEPWAKITGWGARTVARQIQAFTKVAQRLDDDDYIVKADSDLLFVAPWVSPLVLGSGADAVGDGSYIDFRFFQGGCYYLRRTLIPRLEPYQDEAAIARLVPTLAHGGEDEITYHLLRHVGARVWLTRFMAIPDEAGRFRGGWDGGRYSVLHFARGKSTMVPFYRTQLLTDARPE